jgi:hypothetical protein
MTHCEIILILCLFAQAAVGAWYVLHARQDGYRMGYEDGQRNGFLAANSFLLGDGPLPEFLKHGPLGHRSS